MSRLLSINFLQACSELVIPVRQLDSDSAESLRLYVSENFAGGRQNWLWDYRPNAYKYSFHRLNAWEYLAACPLFSPLILFFNADKSNVMLQFESIAAVIALLRQIWWEIDEFYLTNPSGEFLIMYNHHDYLILLSRDLLWLSAICNPLDKATYDFLANYESIRVLGLEQLELSAQDESEYYQEVLVVLNRANSIHQLIEVSKEAGIGDEFYLCLHSPYINFPYTKTWARVLISSFEALAAVWSEITVLKIASLNTNTIIKLYREFIPFGHPRSVIAVSCIDT